MIVFENKPREVSLAEIKSHLGIDLAALPYTPRSLKAAFQAMPRQYFSGWQSSPGHQFEEYEAKKTNLVSTNYIAQLSPSSATHARRASALLSGRLDFPVRVWMASFITRPYLSRPAHHDWYDGVLYNTSGRKVVTIWPPSEVATPDIFRYATDEKNQPRGRGNGATFTLDAGQAVHIPAFSDHFVENVGEEETAAVSFALDTSALLLDIFKHTLEFCLGELRTPYQPRSMGGPRVYGTRQRWIAWRREIESGKTETLERLQAELGKEAPKAGKVLATSKAARDLMRGEWETLVNDPASFNNRELFNP